MNKMHEDVCIIELCFVPYSYDEEKLTFKAKVCINIHTDELFHVKKKEITLNLFSTRKEIIVMHVYHYYIIGSNSTCSSSKIFYN